MEPTFWYKYSGDGWFDDIRNGLEQNGGHLVEVLRLKSYFILWASRNRHDTDLLPVNDTLFFLFTKWESASWKNSCNPQLVENLFSECQKETQIQLTLEQADWFAFPFVLEIEMTWFQYQRESLLLPGFTCPIPDMFEWDLVVV